uniref:Putative mucin n=1 Tax=Rhipicephalus microplus TaxID=6941 RepID=A0A6G5A7N5_RHIMP
MKTLQFIVVICLLASVLHTSSGLRSIWQHKTCLKFCHPSQPNCKSGCTCFSFFFSDYIGACLNASISRPWMFRAIRGTHAE